MACNAAPARDFSDFGPVTLPWTVRYRLYSEIVDHDFRIDIARPLVQLAPAQRLPVVFVFDSNHTFAMVAQAARALQGGPFPMPPTLIVGVGYQIEDHARWGALRVRDFTPCGDALFDEQYGRDGIAFGGADDFLGFVDDELTPFLAERLPIDVSDRTLVGASLGGLFALYALMTRPGAFNRCVAVSPALYWGAGRIFELEAQLASTASDLPAAIYLAAGGLEEAHDPRCGLVSNLYRLDSILRSRAWPGLEVATQVYEGENHMSVFPGAVTRGLGHVFGGYPDMSDWSRALRA
jgi:predicted alpha/beta superfamily hydrolase